MEKTLVFDMDGTIANLYGYNRWLELLRAESDEPYVNAEPLYDMLVLNQLLEMYKACGWRIVVVSWLAKESTSDYDRAVRLAKMSWLDRYNFPYDEVHLVKYGTTKASCVRRIEGLKVLIDDNAKIRQGWDNDNDRISIDANENIIYALTTLLTSGEW